MASNSLCDKAMPSFSPSLLILLYMITFLQPPQPFFCSSNKLSLFPLWLPHFVLPLPRTLCFQTRHGLLYLSSMTQLICHPRETSPGHSKCTLPPQLVNPQLFAAIFSSQHFSLTEIAHSFLCLVVFCNISTQEQRPICLVHQHVSRESNRCLTKTF